MSVSLDTQEVSKRFGPVVALDNVSLSVPAESFTAIVGESGSGKTTLLRCFNRMVDPDSGSVTVGDRDVRESDPIELRRSIGYVQQHGGLLPHWTVSKNVALILRAMNRESSESVKASLSLVGLDPVKFGSRFPRELSGGQRQRVALARALAAKPRALLLDEPFGALDAVSRGEVQDAFIAVQRELALTMLLVTHDLSEAARLSRDIVVMKNGKIEQRGHVAELRDSPATEYVAALIGSAMRQLEPLQA
ncbi:MAG TPA: ATP-binding cassette domain-containing protein [Gemmatimonadaceae bacterium]|nr:ATP-binding cassette domain-containing protein [Gemmatimonadaceae bacterium]